MSTATTFDPVAEVCGRLEFARKRFLEDLESMPAGMLSKDNGGKSRNPYDLTYELIGMHSMFTNLLQQRKGEIEGPNGWVKAPTEFQNKEKAASAFDDALISFVDALHNYKGDAISDEFESPFGPFTPLGMANLSVWHIMYHSGQLNYIQTLHGDDDFHWRP
ncbi:MAG: hypothetical protein KF784_12170 [Fimbriimonadaceae bacterium]|nr:hypothetical protein [Fimbriimonadaceae bacterium]